MRKNLNSSILLVAGRVVIRLNINDWSFFMFLTKKKNVC